ncbi:MAG: acyl carrier protein [Candidatus Liberibacter europaeus]|uniref:Acyl carrier protein n=1 Tax=Candidatus Liberibacter europaeus TaxID=744859 RepID=A0A2T4VXH5_9HYPH|nr:MAG: acyl carrier protein [Candidatus Liberibacter europaeus]
MTDNIANTDNVLDLVKSMVAQHLNVDPQTIVESSRFIEDLGADSLDTVEIVMAFEEKFGISIEEEASNTILTVGDAVKFITKKIEMNASKGD